MFNAGGSAGVIAVGPYHGPLGPATEKLLETERVRCKLEVPPSNEFVIMLQQRVLRVVTGHRQFLRIDSPT